MGFFVVDFHEGFLVYMTVYLSFTELFIDACQSSSSHVFDRQFYRTFVETCQEKINLSRA